MFSKNLICPISKEKIDSNVSRITVFLNVVLMVFFIITQNPIFIFIVSLDYCVRAFINVKYSPLRFIALNITKIVKLNKKQIDLAPKIFASRLGFLCALFASILIILNLSLGSIIVAVFLMTLSIMDSVFNFCVGCWIYTLIFPFFKYTS